MMNPELLYLMAREQHRERIRRAERFHLRRRRRETGSTTRVALVVVDGRSGTPCGSQPDDLEAVSV